MRTSKLLLIPLVFLACSKKQPGFVGTYVGAEYTSFWTIELLRDSTYTYRTEGHIGDTFSTGTITFAGDTIYLDPHYGKGFPNRRGFILYRDSCLIELDYLIEDNMKVSLDFCKGRIDNWTSGRWNLETLTPIETTE